MRLSKGEYTQFSLKGRLNLLTQFGIFIKQKKVKNIKVEIYMLHKFYVEIVYKDDKIIDATPVKNNGLVNFYL